MEVCRFFIIFYALVAVAISGGATAFAQTESDWVIELARALKSSRISAEARKKGIKTIQQKIESMRKQSPADPGLDHSIFETEQLLSFMKLEDCKNIRQLQKSVQYGSIHYKSCSEDAGFWDVQRTVRQISPDLDEDLIDKDLFRKRAYHHAVTNSIVNLITLEIEEMGRRWSKDEIHNRASLLVKENCKNCTALDIRLITSHVTDSILQDLKLGSIPLNPIPQQVERVCSLLKVHGYDFSPTSLVASPMSYINPLGRGNREISNHLRKRIAALHGSISMGKESLLLLTHSMTDLQGSDPAHVKLKCLKVKHSETKDTAHNILVMKASYLEAKTKIKHFLSYLIKELFMAQPVRSEIDSDIQVLTKLSPRSVGEALYEQSDQTSAVCEAIKNIQKDDDWDETVEDIKIWGSVVAGVGLTMTGVFVPAGATVLGASLSMTALASGTALGAGLAADKWVESIALKEDSELLSAAAVAAGNDPHLARISREEWARYENLRVSAMIDLGLSAADIALFVTPLVKSGKSLKAANDGLEKGIANRSIVKKSVQSAEEALIEVTAGKVQRSAVEAEVFLRSNGITQNKGFVIEKNSSYLDYLMETSPSKVKIKSGDWTEIAEQNDIFVLKPEGVRGTGKIDPFEIAVFHPEMKSYIKKAEKMGYKVAIDPSLDMTRVTAYLNPTHKNKMIGLSYKSKWHDFQHEFQHLELDYAVKKSKDALLKSSKLKEMQGTIPFGSTMDLSEADDWITLIRLDRESPSDLAQLKKEYPKLDEALSLHQKTGLPELAVDETLASQREIEALRKSGYGVCDSRYYAIRKQALDHQINELEKLSSATALQTKTYIKAQAELKFLETLRGTSLNGALSTVFVAGAGSHYLIKNGKDYSVVKFQ